MATHCPPNPPNASKPLEEWAAVTLSFRSARNWPDPGAFSERRHITKLYVGVVSLICALACTLYPVEAQPAKEDRIVIGYVAPENPEHMPVFTLLKDNEALERVRNLLAPIRWPRTLRLEIKGCDGESNAWYEEGSITVCYEFVEDIWKNANSSGRPPAIAPEDALIGPLMNVFLHEAGHALFDLLAIPVLGREEDAADQVAAYYMLQYPKETKRRLIIGAAFSYAAELNVRGARDLYKPRVKIGRHISFADEHGTPAQRLYNLLCVAYGSDKELFTDVVEKRYLPESRAEICEGEYRQVDFAYRRLIAPHVDNAQ